MSTILDKQNNTPKRRLIGLRFVLFAMAAALLVAAWNPFIWPALQSVKQGGEAKLQQAAGSIEDAVRVAATRP